MMVYEAKQCFMKCQRLLLRGRACRQHTHVMLRYSSSSVGLVVSICYTGRQAFEQVTVKLTYTGARGTCCSLIYAIFSAELCEVWFAPNSEDVLCSVVTLFAYCLQRKHGNHLAAQDWSLRCCRQVTVLQVEYMPGPNVHIHP